MPLLSLREAADAVGVSKSTLFRAIRAGRLSATRDDDGQFQVDPAELHRVYDPASKERNAAERVEARGMAQDATEADTLLRIRNAELEAQISALKQILENEKERAAELKSERDSWKQQAERLALAPPAPVTVTVPESRGFWPFRRRA